MLRKRWLALAGVTVAATSFVAMAATTYQVQTKLSNTGGTLKLRDNAAQTAVGSVVYSNFTTSAQVPVTVTASPGYSIASITQGGKPTLYNPASPWTGSFQKSAGATQTLLATFVAQKLNVSTSVTSNPGDYTGTVSPSTTVNYNGSAVVTAIASSFGYLDSVRINGVAYPGTPASGQFQIPLNNITESKNVSVTFKKLSVSAGNDQVGVIGSKVTLAGSSSGNASLLWTQTAGPAATLAGATGATASFTPSAAGTYSFRLAGSVAGNVLATSNVSVTVASSATDYLRSGCNGCHSPVGVSPSAAFGQWSGSRHQAANVNCVTCHTDAAMPTPVNRGSVDANSFAVTGASAGVVGANYCAGCHAASVAKVQASIHYTVPAGKLVCTDCHEAGHNPVFKAGACSGCHATVTDHTAENLGGKSCIQCHDKHNPQTVTGSLGPATSHPAVTLFTFEEVGMQMAGGQPVPVQVDANGKGMPYSPKMTCGTANCHVKNGVDYTYDKISDHAFHSNEGRSEYVDSADGKFDATKSKPWTQSTAMVGKW